MNKNVIAGEILNFGDAPYQHDEKNQPSYFIEIKDEDNHTTKLWGVGIRSALDNIKAKVGDKISLSDEGKVEGSRQRIWTAEHYQPEKTYQNTLTGDIPKEKTQEQNQEVNQNKDDQSPEVKFKTQNIDEIDLPRSVLNNYIPVVKNRNFKDESIVFYDKQSQALQFEFRHDKLHTDMEDSQTVNAMLDVATSKNWSAIQLKGTEEFRRSVWLEATLRGIQTKGYQPTEHDISEFHMRQELARSEGLKNTIETTEFIKDKQVQPEPLRENPVQEAKELEGVEPQKATDKPHITAEMRKGMEQARERYEQIKAEKDQINDIDKEKAVSLINSYRDEVPIQIQESATKNSSMAKLKVIIDEFKDHLDHKAMVGVESLAMSLAERFKDNPKALDEKLARLGAVIPELASGEKKVTTTLQIKEQPNITIQPVQQHGKDRGK